jgi:hypothetical protein
MIWWSTRRLYLYAISWSRIIGVITRPFLLENTSVNLPLVYLARACSTLVLLTSACIFLIPSTILLKEKGMPIILSSFSSLYRWKKTFQSLLISSNPSIIICARLVRIFVNFEDIINLLSTCANSLSFCILVSLFDFVDLRLLFERDRLCSNIEMGRVFLVTGQDLEVLYIIRLHKDRQHVVSIENKTELGYLVHLESRETIETNCNARGMVLGIICQAP